LHFAPITRLSKLSQSYGWRNDRFSSFGPIADGGWRLRLVGDGSAGPLPESSGRPGRLFAKNRSRQFMSRGLEHPAGISRTAYKQDPRPRKAVGSVKGERTRDFVVDGCDVICADDWLGWSLVRSHTKLRHRLRPCPQHRQAKQRQTIARNQGLERRGFTPTH